MVSEYKRYICAVCGTEWGTTDPCAWCPGCIRRYANKPEPCGCLVGPPVWKHCKEHAPTFIADFTDVH